MTETRELILDESESQLPARRPNGVPAVVTAAQQPPSVESMLMVALERGTDAATLERLVALAERVRAQQAEQAFNEAMLQFRMACPPILRTSTATDPEKNKVLYRFADLSEVTKVVNPHLYANGLSYTWDSEAAGDETTVICWIHHVAGARRSAKFTAKGTGTRIMNPAQIEASVVTFGKRQSLVMALGIQTDLDDDGRRAAPREQPAPDPTQPKVAPRAERADAPRPEVTARELNELLGRWRQRAEKPQGKASEFAAWAAGVLKRPDDAALLSNPKNWTAADIERCEDCLL